MLDDFERPAQMRFDVLRQLSGVPRIGPQVLHARKDIRQIPQAEDRARAVLDIRPISVPDNFSLSRSQR
jgi:hypothetical protein